MQTDALLSFAWIALLVVALVAFGWRSALLALALSFVYVAAANPLAKRLARNMLGYRTTCAETGFEPDYSVEAMIQRSEKTDRRLAHIAAKPAIARVLAAHDLSGEDLEEQFGFLMTSGVGDLAWEIVSIPSDLEGLLDMRARVGMRQRSRRLV